MEENQNVEVNNLEENINEVEVVEVEEEIEKEPPIKNITKFDYKVMKYLNLYLIQYKRKSFIIYLVLSLITVGIAIYSFVDSLVKGQPDYVFPVLFVVFAAYMLYQGFSIEKSLDRQLVNFFNNREVTIQEMEIDDEYLHCARGTKHAMGESVKIDWITISEIHELPQYYYLFQGKNPIVIDKNPEAFEKGTFEELETIIKEKAASRLYKKIDKDIVKKEITYVHQEVTFVSQEAASHAEEVPSEVVEEGPSNEIKEEHKGE